MVNFEQLKDITIINPILQELKNTEKEFIKINLQELKTLPWQSKVGGDPYLLDLKDYPKNSKGEYLRFLAQINFNETPKLKDFPQSGILQFFILAEDDYYGANLKGERLNDLTKQDNFRVIYIKDVIQDESRLVKDFSFLPLLEEDWYMPIEKECAMSFAKEEDYLNPWDFRFDKFKIDVRSLSNDEWNLVYDTLAGTGSKIGGYPAFVQDDPRYCDNGNEFDTLLFQLDSDDENGIMWGDVGIANFFINHKKLKELDFSEVLYNWDCS